MGLVSPVPKPRDQAWEEGGGEGREVTLAEHPRRPRYHEGRCVYRRVCGAVSVLSRRQPAGGNTQNKRV